jgi:hypothetical protein
VSLRKAAVSGETNFAIRTFPVSDVRDSALNTRRSNGFVGRTLGGCERFPSTLPFEEYP